MTALVVAELTESTLEGTGVFDVLMRAAKVHLEQEFLKGRIKGPEYATVYLGSLDNVMRTSLAFLLEKRKNDLEAQLLSQQILMVTQQTANAAAEALNIPKQGAALDSKTALTDRQTLNAVIEGTVLTAQECKLRAEFDLTQAMEVKTAAETTLLNQKTATERAQVLEMGVDDNSVVGKQKLLYAAQTNGFTRDAEQKVAKVMVDSWNVRRTTDEGTVADATNMLNDTAVGRAVTKLLSGVGA